MAKSKGAATTPGFSQLPNAMGMPQDIDVGSHIWVGDPELAWTDGIVMNVKGTEAEVQTGDGKMTYCGNILIAVNPFQSLSHLYDDSIMRHYKGVQLGELSPHVFAIADVAYRAMINEGKSNSILVSGESGAGKTETTKMLMRYLAFLGGHAAAEGRTVEQQVLESNPVLEAFGNAKTVRNNNSSCYELVGVNDAHDYLATRKAMDVVGISEKEQDDESKFHLQMTAELLMCDPQALEVALCERVMITPEEIIKRSLDPLGATVSRDGLAKTIYSRLFDCMFPKSTHETFTQKLYQTFKDHKRFVKPKLARTEFTIVHYAGEMGKTKVFLKAGQMAVLDAHKAKILGESAKVVQKHIRSHLSRKRYVCMRRSSIHIQTAWRGKLARQLYTSMKNEVAAATKIQKTFRRQVARRKYIETKSSAIVLQTGLRTMVARNEFRYMAKAKSAVIIQVTPQLIMLCIKDSIINHVYKLLI
ncbi:IQ motif, EF-hand binding site [Corchorus olitorius]|uniref:IQ motif, EF-hand binding site n=1 Tax=Corchorus olitorius TaxID=93759 RepID=A0A1R3KQE6_9ROSI|nr:IQ motif, EF-hand binding site [Corchorus olitorius]